VALAVWCPKDIYIEEPMSLVQAYVAACRRHGVEVLESEPVVSAAMPGGRVAGVETTARSIADSELMENGVWQYAHYYDPVASEQG